jgi:hypothetical protein
MRDEMMYEGGDKGKEERVWGTVTKEIISLLIPMQFLCQCNIIYIMEILAYCI